MTKVNVYDTLLFTMTHKQISPYLTHFVNVRLTPEDWQRIILEARSEHLAPSTWMRKIVLEHLDKNKRKPLFK